MQSFDLIIIGAGPGGYVAAIRGAQLGFSVALVEKDSTLGGTCLNVGCIPSKVLLESSELYHMARTSLGDHGIQLGEVGFDLATLMKRKVGVVKELTDGVAALMKKNKVVVFQGRGRLTAADRVEVTTGDGGVIEVQGRHLLLATGSTPVALPFLPFDGEKVIDSTGALTLERVPEHLVVIGAGAVGLELGSVWRRLGAQVTVLEMMPQITPFADTQMAKVLQRSLKQQGLTIQLKTKVIGADLSGTAVVLSIEDKQGNPQTLTCDKVLVSVGRRPNSKDLGLAELGVELDPSGRITVNDSFGTSVSGVYAIGDLITGPMLAHKAEEEGMAVVERMAGKPGQLNHETIPSVVYTAPELACVGLTEEQAKERKINYRVGRFLFRANGRAKSLGEVEGMVKILAHQGTDRLLGVHIVGPRASEMIAEAVLALEFQASAEDLARTIHAHPTLSEVLKEAALAVDGRAIHS